MDDIRPALKELQDAAIVIAGIQARQAELLKDHAEWLAGHDKAMTEIREAGRNTDARIERLVSAIGQWLLRQPEP